MQVLVFISLKIFPEKLKGMIIKAEMSHLETFNFV
jgi:hypothetical protein